MIARDLALFIRKWSLETQSKPTWFYIDRVYICCDRGAIWWWRNRARTCGV